MRRILITGADGFVGRALSARLVAAGYRVIRVVRARVDDDSVAVGDIANFDQWPSLLADVETVVHLAARAHILRERAPDPLAEFRRVNVSATLQLARASSIAGVRRFVFLSSIGVNGTSTTGGAFSESHQPNPSEPYAISKWEAERGLMEIGAHTTMRITRVRPPLILGPGVKGNLRRLIRLVDAGIPLPFGAIHNSRSFVALDDLCELLAICVTHQSAPDTLFLAADNEEISTPELLRRIAEGLGRPARLVPVPMRALKIIARLTGREAEMQRLTTSLRVDATSARRALNWSAPLGVRQGIRSMAEAYLREKQNLAV